MTHQIWTPELSYGAGLGLHFCSRIIFIGQKLFDNILLKQERQNRGRWFHAKLYPSSFFCSRSSLSFWEPAMPPGDTLLRPDQCAQMARLFFNIWPFITMQIWQIAQHICHSRFKILPNSKKKFFKIAQILLNFANVAKFRQIWSHWAWFRRPEKWLKKYQGLFYSGSNCLEVV